MVVLKVVCVNCGVVVCEMNFGMVIVMVCWCKESI